MQHWRIWGRSHAARRHWLVRRGNGASQLRDNSSGGPEQLSRIARQNSEIAASVAQQQTDRAIYRSVTGRSPRKKVGRQ